MELQDSRLGKAAVVDVAGRMDAAGAPLFEAHCDKLIARGDRALVMDFDDLEYLSSAGLRVLLALAKKLKPLGGRILICGLKGTAKEIFDVSGFSSLFPFFDTLEAAANEVL